MILQLLLIFFFHLKYFCCRASERLSSVLISCGYTGLIFGGHDQRLAPTIAVSNRILLAIPITCCSLLLSILLPSKAEWLTSISQRLRDIGQVFDQRVRPQYDSWSASICDWLQASQSQMLVERQTGQPEMILPYLRSIFNCNSITSINYSAFVILFPTLLSTSERL